MKSNIILQIQNLSRSTADRRLLQNVTFSVRQGECWAITGVSGSGKSTLIHALQNYRSHSREIKFQPDPKPLVVCVSHQNRFKNHAHTSTFYYQQRFNSYDSEDAQTTLEMLRAVINDEQKIAETLEFMQLDHLPDTSLLHLSNGEHKRFQLAKALLRDPDWLLLDNPYTGLDKDGRQKLNVILHKIQESGMQVLMTTTNKLPQFITHVCNLSHGKIENIYTREEYDKSSGKRNKPYNNTRLQSLAVLPAAFSYPDFNVAVDMKNVEVHYQQKPVLKDINWTVKKGERWCISGPNGSGKSTLLSLITGDNPQAFANDITLFDRKKGSGESIWDIKRKIGFVSPELHHYFDRNFTGYEVVASGFFDTVGLFKKLSPMQVAVVYKCMNIFGISDFEKKRTGTLSDGEQRLVLLARAMVKNPPLLILDEPCQGLDEESTRQYLQMLNKIYKKGNKTLLYVSHYEHQIPVCITHTLKLFRGTIKDITISNEKKDNRNSRRWSRA